MGAGTTTYEFPQTTGIDTDGNYLELTMAWPNSDVNETRQAEDYGLAVVKYGGLTWEYDLDDPLMVPGEFAFVVADPNETFVNEIFEGSNAEFDTPRATVTLELNGSVEFKGKLIENETRFDKVTKLWRFVAVSETDIINNQLVFDIDNVAVNPFGYSSSGYRNAVSMIEDIYQQVDATITESSGSLKILHSWEWGGFKSGEPFTRLNGFYFTDIYVLVDYFFFNTTLGIKTTGDVLKRLANDFGAFTGLLHNGQAFFKELFVYSSSYTQTLGKVLEHTTGYRYNLLDWVRIETISPASQNPTFEEGTETNIDGRYLRRDIFGYFHNDFPNPGDAYSGTTAVSSGDTYFMDQVRQADIDSNNWLDHGELLAKFWYEFRNTYTYMIVDEFIVEGVGYEFLRDFTYDGIKYQALKMVKNYDKGTTKIEALYLGA